MRNIFLFIRRYFNVLAFLFFQATCFYFIVSYSKYHEAAFGATTNRITGAVNRQYNKVEYYFQLRRTNDSLVKANGELYNRLRGDFNFSDSADKKVTDTIKVDSTFRYRKFNYLSAKVVSNSVSSQNNYIVLWGDNVRHFKKNMGVVDINNNAVGIITEVDGDYAVVMSLLHKDSHISGKLARSGESGTLSWNGEQPNILSLSNIPKSAKISKGDSVVTSGYSAIFPKGIMLGRIIEVRPESATSNFKLTLHSATDFYNLEYVYAIQSADADEVKRLTDKAKAAN